MYYLLEPTHQHHSLQAQCDRCSRSRPLQQLTTECIHRKDRRTSQRTTDHTQLRNVSMPRMLAWVPAAALYRNRTTCERTVRAKGEPGERGAAARCCRMHGTYNRTHHNTPGAHVWVATRVHATRQSVGALLVQALRHSVRRPATNLLQQQSRHAVASLAASHGGFGFHG